MKIINYFFEVVVPQILDYFKENKEVIPNYLVLEVLRKDKQYQEQIEKILELSQKGSHNERTKEKYKSNPNIGVEDSKNNIEIVKCTKYVDKFYEMTREYQKEHSGGMKNMRADRKKSFYDMVNDSKIVVADEMIFTSDNDLFKNLSKDELYSINTLKIIDEKLEKTLEDAIVVVMKIKK